MARGQALQVAFDKGGGARGISHCRANPYCALVQPKLHAAWEHGWVAADAEIVGKPAPVAPVPRGE